MGDPTDFVLACLHHLLVFALAGIIAAEWVLVRPGLKADEISRLARIDAFYGATAMAVIVVGAARVWLGIRGWEFYVYNSMFWAKMAAFAGVGLLSIAPTIRIARWRRDASRSAVPDAEIASVRGFLRAEIAVFALIPLFAAALARGYGS